MTTHWKRMGIAAVLVLQLQVAHAPSSRAAINDNVRNITTFIDCLVQKKQRDGTITDISATVECLPKRCKLQLVDSASAQQSEEFETKDPAGIAVKIFLPRVVLTCKDKPFVFFPSYILNPGSGPGGGRVPPDRLEWGTQLGTLDVNNQIALELGEQRVPNTGMWGPPNPLTDILAETGARGTGTVNCALPGCHAVVAPKPPAPVPRRTEGDYMSAFPVAKNSVVQKNLLDICNLILQYTPELQKKYEPPPLPPHPYFGQSYVLQARLLCYALADYEKLAREMGPPGMACNSRSDCESGVCGTNVCQAATCADGTSNGTETDIDCGGGTCPDCAPRRRCNSASDCQSGSCSQNVCALPLGCRDGILNGSETGTDCGGLVCDSCLPGAGCVLPRDCLSDVCLGSVCQSASCGDGVMNESETGVDCGGFTCTACGAGQPCTRETDCQTGLCSHEGVCLPATCHDGAQNGTETGLDCGGVLCDACVAGLGCNVSSDCQTGVCIAHVCRIPTCADGIQDGDETGVDCGGAHCNGCAGGASCDAASDCASNDCRSNTCFQLIQHQEVPALPGPATALLMLLLSVAGLALLRRIRARPSH